ncbi:MAG: hypothetical protein E4H03_04965 [Myxococcales bacterium]|nr:MAG: hypothetical protein E4H03_04965 [Myxococcales bacterium]
MVEADKPAIIHIVNLATRVSAQSAGDEILTRHLVGGLVDGSGFRLENAHSAKLGGICLRQLARSV